MKSAEIRRVYLDFFKEKGHVVVPGIGLIPFDDPTILFTSAGMVQFKKLWATDASLSYLRAVTCQKCIRAGGKDSDIDKIGVTGRHHTFFEMLGNFSFGDYFKKEAIEWAYEFVIDRLKIPEDSLWVSYYFDDKETCHIWKKFLPEERIIPLGEKDNFWGPAGETGPCGPCTELYIDFGVAKGCGKDCLPGCECDRFLEFWNLVFPQYDKQKDGSLVNLKRRGVDTGMGLERVSRILQKTPSNYETDLFLPLIKEIENISGESYENQQKRPSFRITSDHIRAAVFLIDDNILPSNEGRGYVLRRILRRAGITGKNLRVKEYFLKDLAEVVINTMKDVYPSLEKNSELIKRVISEEEEKFHLLLDSAGKNFHDLIGKIQSGLIPGNIAFKLYDTYGIPKDLLEDLASKDNLQIDWIEFEKELEKQKRSSRISTLLGMQKEVVVESPSLTETIFTGYERIQAKGKISAVYLDAKKQLYLVLDSTPFYSEKGGQCGDRGIIEGKGFKFKVKDTQVDEKGIIYHIGKLEKGILSEIKENVEVTATVDKRFREQVSINHTATHLLHYALREILGRDIRQAGSYVSGERLRFDFVSFRQIEKEDIDRVEKLIQEKIMEKTPVEIYEMSVDEAIEKGAIALFMERYGEKVRVIRTGDYHTEVCGGTHISDTGDILLFRITGFSSIGQNLKRIEAVTHREAIDYLDAYKRTVEEIAERVDSESDKVLQKIDRLIAENIKQGRIIEKYEDTYASSLSEKIAEKRESYNIDGIGYYFVAEMIEIEDNGFLGKISDIIADKIEPGITFVGGIKDGKISIILKVSERLKEKFPAVRLIKEISEIIGGQGGGSPTFARGSGKEPNNFHKAVEKIRTLIEIGGKMTKKTMDYEIKIIKLIRKGDRKAKETFVKDNQGLVIYLAKRYAYTPDILPDLIAEGNMGLLKAIDKFDFKKKVKFGTYAYFWIKRFIIRAIMREFEVLKIPERYQEFKERVEEMKRDFMFKNGRNPTDTEIAKSLNLPLEIIKKLKKYATQIRVISSDYYNGEKQVDLFDVIDFSRKGEQALWEVLRNKDILKKIFDRIRAKEKRANIDIWLKVLKLYYGLGGGVQHSYKEIAEKLDVSRQRVHQIKKICLQKLQKEWEIMKKEEEKRNEESS